MLAKPSSISSTSLALSSTLCAARFPPARAVLRERGLLVDRASEKSLSERAARRAIGTRCVVRDAAAVATATRVLGAWVSDTAFRIAGSALSLCAMDGGRGGIPAADQFMFE
jgi:hypothetical protein